MAKEVKVPEHPLRGGQAFRTKMVNIKGFESFTLKTFDITKNK